MKMAKCFVVGQNMAGYLPNCPEDNLLCRFKKQAIEILKETKRQFAEDGFDMDENYHFSGNAKDGEIRVVYDSDTLLDYVLWWDETEIPIDEYVEIFGVKPSKGQLV